MRRVLAFICLFFVLPISTNAAPPPDEVEEKKQNATLVVTGEIIDDLFIEDTSRSKSTPTQSRRMVLLVHEIHKKPEDLNLHVNHNLSVQYHYIPSWNSNQYAGPSRVDITKGDIIKIWLVKGENNQWKSTVSGNTIEHIRYVDTRRNEPIPEPTIHAFNRISTILWKKYQGIVVLAFIILLNILIVIGGLKLRSKQSKMQ